MNDQGTIRVITGVGKGKTTSALGLAIDAFSKGLNLLVVQFLKTPDTSGEHFSASALGPSFTIRPMGGKGFIHRRGIQPEDRERAQRALATVREAMSEGDCGMIVLDEINVACHMGLIGEEDILEIVDAKPRGIELVITGRYALPSVIERADIALEMTKIKHHFDRGVPPQEGIEY